MGGVPRLSWCAGRGCLDPGWPGGLGRSAGGQWYGRSRGAGADMSLGKQTGAGHLFNDRRFPKRCRDTLTSMRPVLLLVLAGALVLMSPGAVLAEKWVRSRAQPAASSYKFEDLTITRQVAADGKPIS